LILTFVCFPPWSPNPWYSLVTSFMKTLGRSLPPHFPGEETESRVFNGYTVKVSGELETKAFTFILYLLECWNEFPVFPQWPPAWHFKLLLAFLWSWAINFLEWQVDNVNSSAPLAEHTLLWICLDTRTRSLSNNFPPLAPTHSVLTSYGFA
jgi:hypothetical protein